SEVAISYIREVQSTKLMLGKWRIPLSATRLY
uniref:Uncharacterized protein n=1 Tax=Aegilops tauschii subsp. strangulata TaxID=200361 RepID=A0A453R1G9_AEGTS